MISAAAGANHMYPWACSITGFGSGLSYLLLLEFAKKIKLDDPLDAFALHVGGGFWGLISVCLVGDKGVFYGVFYPENVSLINSIAVGFPEAFMEGSLVFGMEYPLCNCDYLICSRNVVSIILDLQEVEYFESSDRS